MSIPPKILHVTGDFPDPVRPDKTNVIRTHIQQTAELFDHRVYSLNRVSPRLPGIARMLAARRGSRLQLDAQPFEFGQCVSYKAPGRGILHASMLDELGDWLTGQLRQGEIPDLLVGHKLTIEGVVVARVASVLGIPYALCLQGNTDARILAMRPDLRERFSQIYHHADYVFAFAPWTKAIVDEGLGRREQDYAFLPCPTDLDEPVAPTQKGDGFVTAFHLWNYRQKNLPGMVAAIRILRKDGSAELTVIGGGEPAVLAKCERLARRVDGIHFAGPLDRAEMAARLNGAVALVLPSLRESFGLVFVEALFAGTPIIYPAGAAVDGYFDGLPFAIRVDARDPRAIADAMRRAMEGEAELKAALADWQQSDAAQKFRRAHIAQVFTQGLRTAAGSGAYS